MLPSGCSGKQSALDTGGVEAEQIAVLFWTMVAAGAVIWSTVVALLLYATRRNRTQVDAKAAGRLILWGGAVFPATVLVLLLSYALWLMPSLRPFSTASEQGLRIDVIGRQYWWDIFYRMPDGTSFRAANEIILPVGQRVELSLTSPDVIHSFWIPALGGKMDVIPGRTNRLSLEATKAGVFRGPCAEFCGESHALMALSAVTIPAEEFRRWAARQAKPPDGVAEAGAVLFLRHGCGACHAVRGTAATAKIGPDLSRLGARLTLGAGILPNTEENIARFIVEPDRIKPGSRMPPFGMLPDDDIRAIAEWLKGLQ